MVRAGQALVAVIAPQGCGSGICAKTIAREMRIFDAVGKTDPHMAADSHAIVRALDQCEIRPIGRAIIGCKTRR